MGDLMGYQEENAKIIDGWCKKGWQWGQPITHEEFLAAQNGEWKLLLTPTKPIPQEWLGDVKGKNILGLASGGGQQMPLMAALGAKCTLLDISAEQCASEAMVAKREGYEITIIQGDMTKPLPFCDECFDIIIHPVANCYIRDVRSLFKECARVLKKGGILVCGLDNEINCVFDDSQTKICYKLPFDPLNDPKVYEDSINNDWGIQFSHPIEDQIGGQLDAGLRLSAIFEDTNGYGNLHEYRIPTFYATRSIKE